MSTNQEIILVRIGKSKIELEFSFTKETWNIYCNRQDSIEYFGSVCHGHLNYNEKDIVMYNDSKEWILFNDFLREQVLAILKKYKILKK